jgi:3-isopropylmalate/(R)-2-methylmalate dehydratase large subunit
MRRNIVEKILARAGGVQSVRPGDFVVVRPSVAVLLDTTFWPGNWREVLQVADPSAVVVVLDHLAPASESNAAKAHASARAFVRRFAIERFHDVGRDQGISHVVTADNGYALPGTVLVNQDSHACGAGAFNCAARGVGLLDMLYVVTKGTAWFRVGETVRYELEGQLPRGVYAKDVFLHIAHHYGAHTNQNIEYGGRGMATLGLNARRTLATMGAELSAEFVVFEADDALIEYVAARNRAPFEPVWPDANAEYKARRTIDLAQM